jgi:hypothetical protein
MNAPYKVVDDIIAFDSMPDPHSKGLALDAPGELLIMIISDF